jgi:hypothetical protein
MEQSTRRDMIRQNKEKIVHENHEKRHEIAVQNAMLKNVKFENDNADFDNKKEMWRKVMTQKMGLAKIKELNTNHHQNNIMY